MIKRDYLKKMLSDVFGSQKVSPIMEADSRINRTNNYFSKCKFDEKGRLRFEKLFEIAFLKDGKYEILRKSEKNHIVTSIKKVQISDKLNKHLIEYYDIDIKSGFLKTTEKIDEESCNFKEYVNELIQFIEIFISPALFNNDSGEIDFEAIKNQYNNQCIVQDNISNSNNLNRRKVNSFSSMFYMLNEQEKTQLIQNIDFWNKRILEEDDSDMRIMTFKEYFYKLERESVKFYKNIDNDKIRECLKIAENIKQTYFAADKDYETLDFEVISVLGTYILKLKRIIERQS